MGDSSVIKNIIFDLGGVILMDKPVSVLKNMDVDKKDYAELLRFFEDWKRLDLGEQTLEEKFDECNFSDDIVCKYRDILVKYYEYRDINMGLIDLINKLKHNNYNVYVLSDNNLGTAEFCSNNHPLFDGIDGWVISCNYHELKWDGKLFQILLNKYQLIPEESYFVDDNPSNMEIAYKYNMKWYIFDENEDISSLYDDMRKNWILV